MLAPRAWNTDPTWQFVNVFKQKVNAQIKRTTSEIVHKTYIQIKGMIGKKKARLYIADMKKKNKVMKDGCVVKYEWENKKTAKISEQRSEKKLELGANHDGAKQPVNITVNSGAIGKKPPGNILEQIKELLWPC